MSDQSKKSASVPTGHGRSQGSGSGSWRRPGMSHAEKPKDFTGAMKHLLRYLGRYKITILITCLLACASTVLSASAPRFLGGATDEIFNGLMRMADGTGGIDIERIRSILLLLAVLFAVSISLNYLQGFIMVNISAKITYRLREEISEKIHRLPLQYFDKNSYGDVLSRVTNDVDTINNTLSQGVTQIIMSVTAVTFILVMMITISPLLTVVALLILPFSMSLMTVIMRRTQKYFAAQQTILGKLNGHIEEMLSNHIVVKAFNGEKASVKEFDRHNDELYHASWKANFFSGLMWPIIAFINNIGYVAIVVIGGTMAVGGAITVGGIQAFIQYTRQFGQPVMQLASVAGVLQQTAAAAERVFAFLEEDEESAESQDAVTAINIRGNVVFDHVNFGYNTEMPVIRDFTAAVQPGQKIAIVGHTGAGKTTIVKLLMRFYDVSSGSILIDGVDLREYMRDDLRSCFGMVLQDTWLFNETIAENIRYGRLSATDEEVREAAVAAQAHHFVRTLPEGYQMVINEEAENISAGQKQLLTIARTILANPDILILDEATSNVDTRTEVLIQQAMDHLMRGRTCFIIAHRLSTIRSADLILVMGDGGIVEQGTHDELLAKNGKYAELYNSQFDEAI